MSGVSRVSGATSRYSTKVVLVTAEEFDLSLEGIDMQRECHRLRNLPACSARTKRHARHVCE